MYSFGSRRSNMTKTWQKQWQKQWNWRFTTFPRTKCLSEWFILTSRLVMFVEGIQWASLEIWGHCASDFEECLVTAYNIHQRVPWFYLLLFCWYLCKIISLVWVTGWEYSEFRPHDPNINFWDREFPSYCWDKTTVYIYGWPTSIVRPAIQQHAILDLVIGWDGSTMEECHRGRGMGWWVVQHDVMISRPFGRRGSCVVNLCDFTYRSISILLFHWISQHLNIWSWYT